jgi:uncharacterized Fe-S cluster protein YjdI
MAGADKTKEYSNGEITIVWKPNICIHSGVCVKGLPNVFQPKEKPWIKIEAASTDELRSQVEKCPSGALSYYMNDEEASEGREVTGESIVEVTSNGPLMVYGNLKIKHTDGREENQHKVTAFCRCGASTNKPYCDGSHRKADFKG